MIEVYIDPWNAQLGNDLLFDMSDRPVNRDQLLLPWAYLREACAKEGILIRTADLMPEEGDGSSRDYCSYGQIGNYARYGARRDVRLSDLYITEPPVLALENSPYRAIAECVEVFQRVHAVAYADDIRAVYGVEVGQPIEHFFTPQALSSVVEPCWHNKERSALCMINSYGFAPARNSKLYDERIKAVSYFSDHAKVDLYGHRWSVMWDPTPPTRARAALSAVKHGDMAELRHQFFVAKHADSVRRAYQGPCASKYETFSRYQYALCFENSGVRGYISEKIFDCLFAGTIPIYLGAPDICDYVPKDCFIDKRDFGSYKDLAEHLASLSDKDKENYRQAGREFIGSAAYKPFSKEYFAEQFIRAISS